jgi:beta-lactamase regulating signal transducer with metallopeptidase domain
MSELANHLWQSTLFALAVGLLTLMCRRNHAGVRYWLWFSASIKFFIPFTLLIALGDRLQWASKAPQIAAPAVSATLAQMGRPFVVEPAMGFLSVQEAARSVDWFTLAILSVWVAGTIAMTVARFRTWRQIRAAVRASSPWAVASLPMPANVAVRSTPGVMEPGVVGLWRPVLLVPSGIEDDLTPRQLASVLTHELCHIKRRDNATAAVHMIAEALFWFHPLVWWIGARLVDERERACDQEVLRTCGEPRIYAEGIVNVCKRYVESPLTCVPGVSGANVKNRIRDIMTNRGVAKLSVAQRRSRRCWRDHGGRTNVCPVCSASAGRAAVRGGIDQAEHAETRRSCEGYAAAPAGWERRGIQRDAGVGDQARLSDSGLPDGRRARVDQHRSIRHPGTGTARCCGKRSSPAAPIPSGGAIRAEGAPRDEGPSDLRARAGAR